MEDCDVQEVVGEQEVSEEEEEEEEGDEEGELVIDSEEAFLDYIKSMFPPFQSANEEFFDCRGSLQEYASRFGPYFFTSYENMYYYKKYPMILSTKALEEKGLISMQRQLIIQKQKEFCLKLQFDSAFVDKVCWSGCFPLGHHFNSKESLLVKLHPHRCLMRDIKTNLHISRAVRKKAKRYVITVNAAYADCVGNIRKYHKKDCWLLPNLSQCFLELNNEGVFKTKVISFELWNISNAPSTPVSFQDLISSECPLVAGEIGYVCGSSYTSLTGYHTENSSGTIQLVATGMLLAQLGFTMWDFGMSMKYKLDLGAENIPRAKYLEMVEESRAKEPASFSSECIHVPTLLL